MAIAELEGETTVEPIKNAFWSSNHLLQTRKTKTKVYPDGYSELEKLRCVHTVRRTFNITKGNLLKEWKLYLKLILKRTLGT